LKKIENRVSWFLAQLCKVEKGVQEDKWNQCLTELVRGCFWATIPFTHPNTSCDLVKNHPYQNKGSKLRLLKLEMQVVVFQLIHRDLIPVYQDHINFLCGMFRIQNK
jgi:hypothetical protein